MIAIEYFINPVPKFDVGDLVYCKYSLNKTWEIKGYYYGYSAMHYNLICIKTAKTLLALEEELMLVCKAEYAIDYIRMLDKEGMPPPISELNSLNTGKEVVKMNPSARQALKLTLQEKNEILDELLDRYIDTLRFIEVDKGVNDITQAQVDSILAELEFVRGAEIVKKA